MKTGEKDAQTEFVKSRDELCKEIDSLCALLNKEGLAKVIDYMRILMHCPEYNNNLKHP